LGISLTEELHCRTYARAGRSRGPARPAARPAGIPDGGRPQIQQGVGPHGGTAELEAAQAAAADEAPFVTPASSVVTPVNEVLVVTITMAPACLSVWRVTGSPRPAATVWAARLTRVP